MNKTNRILLGFFAAQLVVIMGMRLGGTEAPRAEPVKVISGLEPSKVTRLQIWGAPQEKTDDPPQEHIDLVQKDGQWGIASADGYPPENGKVKTLLEQLAALQSRTTVLTKSTFHKKLEVAPDRYQRKITITQDGADKTVYLGTSPSFKSLHVRLDGDDAVRLVSGLSTADVGARAWNWVDRAYVNFDEKDVWAVDINNKNGAIHFERNPENDQWNTAQVAGTLNKTVVEDLVRKARSINLEAPIGKEAKPEFGINAPLATIQLVTGTSSISGELPKSTERTTILIGAKHPKENRYFVKASNSDYIVEVAGWAIEPLVEKGPKDLVEAKK